MIVSVVDLMAGVASSWEKEVAGSIDSEGKYGLEPGYENAATKSFAKSLAVRPIGHKAGSFVCQRSVHVVRSRCPDAIRRKVMETCYGYDNIVGFLIFHLLQKFSHVSYFPGRVRMLFFSDLNELG